MLCFLDANTSLNTYISALSPFIWEQFTHLGGSVLGHFVIIFISSGGLSSMFLVELQCAYCGFLYFSYSHPWMQQTFSGQLSLTGIFHCRGSAQSSWPVGRLMVWNAQEIHETLPLPSFELFTVEACPSALRYRYNFFTI